MQGDEHALLGVSTSPLGWAASTLKASLFAAIRFPFGARVRPIGACRLAGSETRSLPLPWLRDVCAALWMA